MTISATIVDAIQSASRQVLGISPRECQWRAIHGLQQRQIVELATGEGKTLVVAIAAITHAIAGHRTFIATANDYLAQRDASEMAPLFANFGLAVSSLSAALDRSARRQVYAADIVYGTIRELGFDTLRDAIEKRSRVSQGSGIVPVFHTLVVDEADSVLIDEALTPLVISQADPLWTVEKRALYQWSASQVSQFDAESDYGLHPSSGRIALTEQGMAKAIHQAMPPELNAFRTVDILHSIERAIDVSVRFKRDVHYIVRDDRINLIDEHTGRVAQSKQMGGGHHQAIEAKENLPISAPVSAAARMTIQELANRMPQLCGVSGTASEEKQEFRAVYDLKVKVVASHQASQRRVLPLLAFATEAEKQRAIVADVKLRQSQSRPVLIGTRSIEKSEEIADALRAAGVDSSVLNARQSHEEASVIARAGQVGQVTVATSMAGRGTDIRLDPEAKRAGGLHVIIAEPHLVARLDRQLAGRCARQGDPGSVQRFVFAEDPLFKLVFGERSGDSWLKRLVGNIRVSSLATKTAQAQAFVSRLQRAQRQQLAESDTRIADDLIELGLDPYLDRLDSVE